MNKKEFQFSFQVYSSDKELTQQDAKLLEAARKITERAYAPYSNFRVGAVAKLSNGEIVSGTNQENASYPVGICAERSLLATVGTLYPNIPIDTIAISYHNQNGKSDEPVSPCGMCRQSLVEYENRANKSIRLILSGMEGEVFIIEKANQLMPLSFGGDNLKG
jgi:cytidine deaminase